MGIATSTYVWFGWIKNEYEKEKRKEVHFMS